MSFVWPRSWRPLGAGLLASGGGAGLAVLAGLIGAVPAVAVVAGYGLGAVLVAVGGRGRMFRPADLVTLGRVVGTCWIGGLVLEAARGDLVAAGRVAVVVLGTVCLLLDGVDGHVARVRGESSSFGARFDMETDAALLLLLSLLLPLLGVTGWWVLAIGGMRYGYGLAAAVVPVLRVDVAPTLAGRVVAVAQGVALLLALILDELAPGWAAAVPPAVALAALCWSFGRHIRQQLVRSGSRSRLDSGSGVAGR